MATVGQALLQPETGWKRYDDTDTNITYTGDWSVFSNYSSAYNLTTRYSKTNNATAKFNFFGTKLRIIAGSNNDRSNNISVTIDGAQVTTFSEYDATHTDDRILVSEITGLTNQEHSVQIMNLVYNSFFLLDAIDIDDTGELKPYSPVMPSTGDKLLRVTVIDSSDHDYQLTSSEIDAFVNWFMKHTSTDTAGYMLSKKVGTQNSKEYVAFDKIISFEVIPLAM